MDQAAKLTWDMAHAAGAADCVRVLLRDTVLMLLCEDVAARDVAVYRAASGC